MKEAQTFQAELKMLYPMLHWIRKKLEGARLSDVEVRRIEIALEEGIVNVISYAYQGEEGTLELHIEIKENEFLEIQVVDTGFPFNPIKHPRTVDPMIPVEELKEGGLGILFMQKLMDKVEYNRFQGKNILTLRKNLSQKSE